MKNFLIICCIALFFLACINKKKTTSQKPFIGLCSYCDSLNNTLSQFDYPLRAIDRNIKGVPLVKNADNTIRDSFNVLTNFEIKSIEDKLFCFIGKTEQEIDSYFPPNVSRTDWGKGRNGNKRKGYSFNRGNFIRTDGTFFTVSELQDSTTIFSLEGIGGIRIELRSIKEEWVFTGTKQDSIRLENCIGKTDSK